MRRKRKNSTLLWVFRPSQQEPLTLVAQPPLPETDKQHVSQPFFKMIYAVCWTAADWLPLSLPENIQLWPSLSETASELWVNWTWWSRHHGNLTGIAVCIAEMDLLLLIGIIFIMIYFTQLLRKLSVYAFDSIQYCISVCSTHSRKHRVKWKKRSWHHDNSLEKKIV